MTLPRSHVFAGRPSHAATIDRSHTAGRSERIWEQRQALGRRLAALRSRAGFSQWEFAPLTGYSRSTLSDAELGRHRLRREFWQRCDDALQADGALISAYDRIESQATAARRSARSQAQAAREEQASQRLHALLPSLPQAAAPAPATSAAPAPVPDDPHAPRTVVERCPHCRQPVTVMIVPAPRTP
ncbi:MAG TPA: helix-turn-helix transcriptional regulator [Streptosporangiaceae bacterium]